jgi:hypothetical protein
MMIARCGIVGRHRRQYLLRSSSTPRAGDIA